MGWVGRCDWGAGPLTWRPRSGKTSPATDNNHDNNNNNNNNNNNTNTTNNNNNTTNNNNNNNNKHTNKTITLITRTWRQMSGKTSVAAEPSLPTKIMPRLALLLLRFVDSNFPGDSLWA